MMEELFKMLDEALNPNTIMTIQEQEDESYTSYEDVTECSTDKTDDYGNR